MGVNLFDKTRFTAEIAEKGYYELELAAAHLTRENILGICRQIGPIVPSFGADADLDYEIETITPSREDKIKPREVANSQAKLYLHTDVSSFGQPPRYTAIACEKNKGKGGNSLTKDAKLLLQDLTDEEREILLRHDVWAEYDRETQEETGRRNPILFERKGVLGIRFRGGILGEAELSDLPSDTRKAIERVEAFTQSNQDLRETRTEAGKVLILDNWRMLHARTDIDDPDRVIYRVLMD